MPGCDTLSLSNPALSTAEFDNVREEKRPQRKNPAGGGSQRKDLTYQYRYSKYYDEFVVLLETGMRVSEFCGLTKSDLDFENRKIRVDHQLIRERNGKCYVEQTKTESGRRYIPMTDNVYQSLKNIVAKRRKPKTEWIIDG